MSNQDRQEGLSPSQKRMLSSAQKQKPRSSQKQKPGSSQKQKPGSSQKQKPNASEKQKLSPPKKRRKRSKKDPFFARRMWTIVAVACAALAIALLYFFESVRQSNTASDVSNTQNLVSDQPDLTTAAGVLEYGSTEDLYKFIKANREIDPTQSFLILHNNLEKRISICRELEKRSDELNEKQRTEIKTGLLSLLFIAYGNVVAKEMPGTNFEAETIETATLYSKDKNPKVAKNALLTLCSIRMLKAYRDKNDAANIAATQDSISDFFSRYPDDPKMISMLFQVVIESTQHQEDYELSTEFLETFKTLCTDNILKTIREAPYGLEGRLLLFKHQLVDESGKPRIKFKYDLDNLTQRFDGFLAEDYTMSPPVSRCLVDMVLGLEFKNQSDKAKYVLEKFLDRIGNEEKYNGARQAMLESQTRLNLKGQVVSFPDHTKTEYFVVQYIGNDDNSLKAMHSMRNLQTIRPNRLLECVLVTETFPMDKIQRYFDISEWKDFKFIQDPKRESAYFQTYPAKWYPSVLVLDKSGKVIAINPTMDYMNLLVEKLRQSK